MKRAWLKLLSEKKKVFCIASIIILFVLMSIRARYSFCNDDETFYISLVHRLWCGEKLIVHEWHPTSLYTPLLYPFYALYKILIPSGQGVIYYFRILYLCIAMLVSVYLYSVLCKLLKSDGISLLMALIYFFYARANIWGMSYYNLFVTFNILTLLLLYNAYTSERKIKYCYGAGMSFAAAVVCNPFLAPFVLLIFLIKLKRKEIVLFFSGVFTIFLYWCMFVFDGSLSDIVKNLPYIFKDSAHSESIYIKLEKYFSYVWEIDKIAIIISILTLVVIVISVITKKQVVNRTIIVLIDLMALCIEIKLRAFAYEDIVFFSLNIMLLPFVCEAIYKRQEGTKLFSIIYIWGNVLAMVYFVASNVGVNVKNTGYIISNISGLIVVYYILKADERLRKGWMIVPITLVFLTVVLFWGRIRFVYRDDSIELLNCRIYDGPAAGLITSQQNREKYEELYSVAEDISSKYPDSAVLITQLCPWMYLSFDSYGTTTPWRVPLSEKLLEDYYILHSDKIPQIVIVLDETVGDYGNVVGSNKNDFSGEIWEYICKNANSMEKKRFCDVYILNAENKQ